MLRVMVHDDIVMSVPPRDLPEVKAAVMNAMTWVWQDVPILCEMSGPGGSWGAISGG
jgi:hypothetical protein